MAAMEGRSMPTYAYASNNPISNLDPDGLQSIPLPLPIRVPIAPVGNPTAPAWCFEDWCIQDWVPRPRDRIDDKVCPVIEMAKARWTCTASCNVQEIPGKPSQPGQPPPPPLPGRVTGEGSGSDEASACLAAKRAATQSAPPGSYARHCQCNCSKGKGR